MFARVSKFSFESEAVWLIIFSLGPAAIGILMVLIPWLLRKAALILR